MDYGDTFLISDTINNHCHFAGHAMFKHQTYNHWYDPSNWRGQRLDTIQDFLCELCMNPRMQLLDIIIFSLNHVIVRPTKIIKDLCKALCKAST